MLNAKALQVRKTAEKLLMAKLKKHVLAEQKAQRAAEKALKKQTAEEERATKRQGTKRKRGDQGGTAANTQTGTVERNPSTDHSQRNETAQGVPSTSKGIRGSVAKVQASEAQQLSAAAELLEDDVEVAEAVQVLQDGQQPGKLPEDVRELSDVESEESAGEIDLDTMVGEGGTLCMCPTFLCGSCRIFSCKASVPGTHNGQLALSMNGESKDLSLKLCITL